MKLAYRVWLDHHGKAFGEGPYELLTRIEKTGSLRRAAKQMGMAYSKAWRLLGILEKRLGFRLIERNVGGRSGGGSQVTPKGRDLMIRYGRFRKELKPAIEAIYRRHFGTNNPPVTCFYRKGR